MADNTLTIESESLKGLLDEIDQGQLQLPMFQREWAWSREAIENLLFSIWQRYPIGALTLAPARRLYVGARPLHGVQLADSRPRRLVLDGQQRLTALYQAIRSVQGMEVYESGRHTRGWFLVDIEKASLQPTRDALRFVRHSNRVARHNDTSDSSLQYAQGLFPLRRAFSYQDWAEEYLEFHDDNPARRREWHGFRSTFLQTFDNYRMPTILLSSATTQSQAADVFNRINTSGKALRPLDLSRAELAVDGINLNAEAERFGKRLQPPLNGLKPLDLLRTIDLVAGRAHGTSRLQRQRLSGKDWQKSEPALRRAIHPTLRFLRLQGVCDPGHLPFNGQVPMLMAAFAQVEDGSSENERLRQWFWTCVFSNADRRRLVSADMLPELIAWAKGGHRPERLAAAQLVLAKDLATTSPNSPVSRGLLALLIATGARDWRTGDELARHRDSDKSIDLHHIFPRAWAARKGIRRDLVESVLNLTPLSSRTNKIISDHAPSIYIGQLERRLNGHAQSLGTLLETHCVDLEHLRRDAVEEVLDGRALALETLISSACRPLIDLTWNSADIYRPAEILETINGGSNT